jgi:hypothetical protein
MLLYSGRFWASAITLVRIKLSGPLPVFLLVSSLEIGFIQLTAGYHNHFLAFMINEQYELM